jgi:hypothetical protein
MAGGGIVALVAIIPTPAAIESAWGEYARLMRGLLDNQELAVNRAYMEDVARAERSWKDAFLALEAGR